jgi:hypothetical protein
MCDFLCDSFGALGRPALGPRHLVALTGPRSNHPDKGLCDVILGAIPYWKTELAIQRRRGGPHEWAEGLRACPTGGSPPRRTLDSVIVAAAISYDRRRAD